MSRSTWKVPYIHPILFSNMFRGDRVLALWARNSVIPACFKDRRMRVHNGEWLLVMNITVAMVGHKFGEFSFTKVMGRASHIFPSNKDKKRKK